MNNVIEHLYRLQQLEMGDGIASPENAAEIKRLRELIPPQIQGHYDRLRARGKKGVSMVRGGVCTECHMKLASGLNAECLRAEDIMICDSCSRYLLADKEEPIPQATPVVEEKPATPKKPRAKRVKKVAAPEAQ